MEAVSESEKHVGKVVDEPSDKQRTADIPHSMKIRARKKIIDVKIGLQRKVSFDMSIAFWKSVIDDAILKEVILTS
jgi:hypothetical protein